MSEEVTGKGRMVVAGNDRLAMPLAAIGFEAVRCAGSAELIKALNGLKGRPEVALVVCGEGQATEAAEAIKDFRETSQAVLLVVPDSSEAKRLDAGMLRKSVERAAGVDLVGKELGKR
jgi:vacuolar-type H+-ATPase subunit F/Vma7